MITFLVLSSRSTSFKNSFIFFGVPVIWSISVVWIFVVPLGIIILLFQALLLAHGGITTIGANTFSMAIAGPILSYIISKIGRIKCCLWYKNKWFFKNQKNDR